MAGLVNGAFSWPRRSRGGQVNDLLRERLADRLRALLQGQRRSEHILARLKKETPPKRGRSGSLSGMRVLIPSVRDEAIDQAGAAGGFQLVLAAAARAMRGVPGLHVPRLLQAGAVMAADDRRSFAAFCPVE